MKFKSKETENVVESKEVQVEQQVTPNLTRYMIGTYVDATNGEWMLSYVKFDPITKTMGEVKTERIAGDEEVLRERLVIRQGQLGLLEPGDATDTIKNEQY